MKKKLLTGILVLGTAAMLCGFDSAETVESLSQKMMEASASVENESADMALNVDLGLDIGDGQTTSTIAIAAKGDFSLDAFMDPLSMKMDGSMSLSTFGQTQEMSMQMYGITNDAGELETYTYTEDSTTGESGWVRQVMTGMNVEELMGMSQSMGFEDMAEWGFEFELAPEAADFNGTECYLLSMTVDSDSFATMMQKVSEIAGEELADSEDLNMALAMLDGIKMNIAYYIDTATYLPVGMHLDMNDSDFSIISQLLQASMATGEEAANTTVDFNMNDFSVDLAMSYGDAEEVVVPEEAIASAVDVSEMTDEVSELLESEMEMVD